MRQKEALAVRGPIKDQEKYRDLIEIFCDLYIWKILGKIETQIPKLTTIQCCRKEIHIGGAVHCIPSHSVHCYKGNILSFDNYWGAGLQPPCPPVPMGLQ